MPLKRASIPLEICILAGGLSSRMGRDKSRLRLGRRTLLGHVKTTAATLSCPVRIIKQDIVARCGPLGGIYTALATTRAQAVLFLACDMPFVTEDLLRKLVDKFSPKTVAVFTQTNSPGFPFILRSSALPAVQQQIAESRFALHKLAKQLKAKVFQPQPDVADRLFNVNTPEDWTIARTLVIELSRQQERR